MAWHPFSTWAEVLAAARRGDRLGYQAPFDRFPTSVVVTKIFKNDKMRISPLSNQGPKSFVVDAGHLSRFRSTAQFRGLPTT